MSKKLKKIVIFLIIILSILYIAFIIINQKFEIKHISPSLLFCGIIILSTVLLLNTIRNKLKDKREQMLICSISFSLTAIISCLFILGIEAFIKSPKKYYDVYVEELSEDYDIVLCEYLHLKSLEGMLCVKINDIVYLKLKDTSYCVEPNHSLSDPKNMSLTYDKETGVLTMRYTWTEGSEYYENKTTYFVD